MQIEKKYTLGFDTEWDLEAVRRALTGARHTVLVAHTNADGDAVGALCGMAALVQKVANGHAASVTALLPDGVPDELSWLPSTDRVLSGKSQATLCCEAIAAADLVIGLDISGLGRTGSLEAPLRASSARKMLVDHHMLPEREVFDIVVSEPHISSTCELVYWLMSTAFGGGIFGREAATCLYTGINTDTGSFSFSNDRESVYLAAADLLSFDIDPMAINRSIKNVFTVERLKFFGFAMSERLTVYKERQVALMVLSAADIREHGVQSAELTGLINEVMKLKDIDCGILVREEEPARIRLSLRSKRLTDVNALARELFEGGGHERAAGATSNTGLAETVAIVKQKMKLDDAQ